MRWWLWLVVLMLVPVCHAAATSGWYYAGDTFKLDGVVYSVEGFSTDNVLLSVGSRSHVINLGECAQTPLAKYCYTQTAYPDDEAHIKYQGGRQYYGYYLSINAITPKLEVTRTMSPDKPGIGTQTEIAVTIKNTADVTVESIAYAEAVPGGVAIISGPGAETGSIAYSVKSLSPGKFESFRYYLRPKDYVSASLQPSVTYSYAGQRFNATVSPISLAVATPLEARTAATSTINLDQVGNWTLNVSNVDPDRDMTAHIAVRLPEGLHKTALRGLTEVRDGEYIADVTLAPGKSVVVRLDFIGSISGKFTIPATLTANIAGTTFTRQYNQSVTAKADLLVPSITLSSTRANYRPGDPLTISGVLKNTNAVTTFKTIGGKLSAPGLFPALEFDHQEFPPQRTLTEAEQQITIPYVNESKSYTITLSGHYTTPGGEVYAFDTAKSITVAPVKDLVRITRTVEPAVPVAGGNLTVTVSARNAFNQYISYTTHESYDPALTRIGGITYSEGSLDRDGAKQLYIYQLQIPANYTHDRFNITTVVNAKGEGDQRFTTQVLLEGAKPDAKVTVPAPAQNTTAPAVVAQKEKGFLAKVWDWLGTWFD